ncbi:prenyltransferase/squalene oxidase repeat-containing protein [Enhygromyxa salina]|uniref:prenyltransferase/squalene oxidase repeat-containing protein n=1 Tax=Enhygromyxa salina TaxID=215803 RepID=UPI0015E78834|nr:prenyltransferase/squalene oxidase repeat-containing protein [Enhygromyxa salina]
MPPRPRLDRGVLDARDVLAQRVLDSINAEGAIIGECKSRALESALALCLLQRLDMHPAARERIVGYLQGLWFQDDLDPFHHALTASVLGWDARITPTEAIDNYLEGFEHFSSDRKRILFTVVLGAVSGLDLDLALTERDFAAKPPHQRWVTVLMRALKVLYFVGRGQPEHVSDEDVNTLLSTLEFDASGTWEQYLLGHLLTLLALNEIPAHAAIVRRCANQLLGHQRDDGGFSFITRMEIFATATAGLGLVGAGHDGAALYPAGDFLLRHQQPDGGWGYAQGVRQTDVDDTAYCVEFLRALDPHRYAPALARAEQYMLSLQNPDGGFPTFTRGASSEVAMTAAVLNALAPSKDRYPTVFRRGIEYIIASQNSDGTFERSWSCAHSNAIFRSLLAMQALRDGMSETDRTAAERRAMSYLRLSQNENGGWGHVIGDESDPISSAYALITLSHFDAEFTIGRGVDYLVDQQQCNGGYLSRPDGSGPRPIAYDVPVLADHFALIALDHIVSTHPRAM